MSTRTDRQHTIDRAVVKTLREVMGRSVPAAALASAVEIKVDYIEPTVAEIEDAIRHAERAGRIVGAMGETGKRYKLTPDGELWALEVRL